MAAGPVVPPPKVARMIAQQQHPIAGRNTSGQTTATTPNNSFLQNVHPPSGPVTVYSPPKAKVKTSVSGMQKFLVSKGFNIAVDGVNGPETQAAAAAFRSHADPQAFNVSHGLIGGGTDASSSGPQAPVANPNVPAAAPPAAAKPKRVISQLPNGNGFFTTQAAAQNAIGADEPGLTVKFQKGKGYYIGTAQTAPSSGAPATPQQSVLDQAKQIVAAQVDPIIQEIQKVEQARATAGQNAITGYTTAEQQLLNNEPGIASAAYGAAQQGQNAIDAAIAGQLKSSGDQNASALGAKLAAIAADPATAARINGQASSDVTGNVGAQYASNSATASALGQEGAADQGYLAKLPGIAGLAGLQASKGLQGQVNTDLQTQLGQITSQVPGMTQSALSSLLSAQTESQKNQIAAIISSGYDPATGQLTASARAALANALGVDPVTGAPTARTVAAASSAATKAAAASTKANTISVGVSKAARAGIALNAQGQPVLVNGHTVKFTGTTTPGTPKVPTAEEVSKLVDAWKNGTSHSETVTLPNPDNNGNPVTRTVTKQTGQLQYRQAYQRLRAMGVKDVKARQYLDSVYGRGEQGRAWLTNEEQKTLRSAGLNPGAATVKGHGGILRKRQVDALRAAGDLPPGQETSDGFYVIAG